MPEVSNLRQPDAGVSEWLTVADTQLDYQFPACLSPEEDLGLNLTIGTRSYETEPVCISGWKTLFGMVGVQKQAVSLVPARGLFVLFLTNNRMEDPHNISEFNYTTPYNCQKDVRYMPIVQGSVFRFEMPVNFDICFCKFFNTHVSSEGIPNNGLIYFKYAIYARGR